MNITICTPNDTYVIVEKIHSKEKWSIPKTNIGPELIQVHRHILLVCDVQDIYRSGEKLPGMPNDWQLFQDLIGWNKLTTRPTGERQFTLQYAGFQNVVVPLPKIGDLLPESWTSAHLTPTPTLFHYGRDPIPHIKLYGNPTVNFTMPGGQPPATAIAIYRKATDRLEFPDPAQRERVLRSLVTQP